MISFWNWESQTGININILVLALNVLLFWAILIITEMGLIKLAGIKLNELRFGSKVKEPTQVDTDVQQEKDTVSNNYVNNNVMKVYNLSKKFGNFDAVRGLTFGVREKVREVEPKITIPLTHVYRSASVCLGSTEPGRRQPSGCSQETR
jgi:hypothetical protein